jgi:adenylate cyclase
MSAPSVPSLIYAAAMAFSPTRSERYGAVTEVPFHKRFHVRTTALFGTPILILLAVLGALSYRFASAAELTILQSRIRGIVVGLSRSIDPATVRALDGREDEGSREHRELVGIFDAVARAEPEVRSIYVFVPTGRRHWLRFACDWVRSGTPGQIGELYDARQAERMEDALREPIVESSIYADAWGEHLSGYAPIRDAEGRTVALVGVDFSAQRVTEVEERALLSTLAMYGVALVLLAIGGAILGRAIRWPIQRVIDATSAIERGELSVRTKLGHRKDELGVLARRIDRMAGDLEERERMRAIFGRYVSEDVARRALSGGTLSGEEREVTVLVTDLRRYSTITETASPVDVVDLLNEYLTAMTEVIHEHDGCVIELLGDGMFVVFGAPTVHEDHAERAVRCALAMRARLEQLNEAWEASGVAKLWSDRGIARLGARTGLHSGDVVAGDFGSRSRTKYSVIGEPVNIATQLEALNEELGTTVLISAAVRARLPSDLAGRAAPKGAHLLGARAQSMEVYAL